MAQEYPLYDDLVNRVSERELKGVDIDNVCSVINNISLNLTNDDALEHYREIGAIIMHYAILNDQLGSKSTTPYESKVMVGGKGLLYYITNLPPMLQQIIAQYIDDEVTSG